MTRLDEVVASILSIQDIKEDWVAGAVISSYVQGSVSLEQMNALLKKVEHYGEHNKNLEALEKNLLSILYHEKVDLEESAKRELLEAYQALVNEFGDDILAREVVRSRQRYRLGDTSL